jgi:hypothetical protein
MKDPRMGLSLMNHRPYSAVRIYVPAAESRLLKASSGHLRNILVVENLVKDTGI